MILSDHLAVREGSNLSVITLVRTVDIERKKFGRVTHGEGRISRSQPRLYPKEAGSLRSPILGGAFLILSLCGCKFASVMWRGNTTNYFFYYASLLFILFPLLAK